MQCSQSTFHKRTFEKLLWVSRLLEQKCRVPSHIWHKAVHPVENSGLFAHHGHEKYPALPTCWWDICKQRKERVQRVYVRKQDYCKHQTSSHGVAAEDISFIMCRDLSSNAESENLCSTPSLLCSLF